MHVRRSSCWIWLLLVLPALVCVSPLSAGFADDKHGGKHDGEHDDGTEGADGEAGELVPAEKGRAKELADALKKAAKKAKIRDALLALEAIEGLTHGSFEKPLLKLMVHQNGTIAVKAAELAEARRNDKFLKKMWKCLGHKNNDRRYALRAIVYRAHGWAGEPLNKKQFDEIRRDWRAMIGNPQVRFSGPLATIAEYARLTKDKRMARPLAEELDEPGAENVNSDANQPADWWERRWNMWKPMRAPAVEALTAITGQEFETTDEAKEWIKSHKRDGFEW